MSLLRNDRNDSTLRTLLIIEARDRLAKRIDSEGRQAAISARPASSKDQYIATVMATGAKSRLTSLFERIWKKTYDLRQRCSCWP